MDLDRPACSLARPLARLSRAVPWCALALLIAAPAPSAARDDSVVLANGDHVTGELKELERENARLKRLLGDAELDKAILREAANPNF